MNVFETPNIGIAIYNEGKNLKKTLLYLRNSILQINFKEKPHLFVCFNGCDDNSVYTFLEILNDLEEVLIVHILSSEKGKLRAHKVITDNINNSKPVIFIDADVFVSSYVIKRLLKVIEEDQRIMVASAYPYVIRPKNLGLYKRLIFPILNIKRIYPEIEICKNNVNMFHPDAKSEFERKARIYFHGRCFIIRNKYLYKFPRTFSNIIGDDTFLSFVILKKYPPGSIIVIYDARIYSQPQLSIRSYLKSWYRIRKDLDNIYKEYPDFLNLKRYVEMKINWKFLIYQLNLFDKIWGILFFILRIFEVISYKIISDNIYLDKLWKYKSKEN